MSGRRPGRGGFTAIEAIVALALGVIVVSLGVRVVLHASRMAREAMVRDDELLALRTLGSALRRELAGAGPDDLVPGRADSVRVRAYRGAGVVCGSTSDPREVVVAWEGMRQPDPSKDSVEVTTRSGGRSVLRLRAASAVSAICPGSGSSIPAVLLVAESTLPALPVLARVFESGSYHVASGALRYRVGAAGRQPLTPSVWRGSGVLHVDSVGLRADVVTRRLGDTVTMWIAR